MKAIWLTVAGACYGRHTRGQALVLFGPGMTVSRAPEAGATTIHTSANTWLDVEETPEQIAALLGVAAPESQA